MQHNEKENLLDRIQLRHVNDSEVRNTFTWLSDPVFRKLFLMKEAPVWNTHIAYFEKIKKDPTQKVYAIYADDKHIGNCGFKYIKNQTAELWIYIGDENFRGKHLAKPACNLLIADGEKELGIKKIYLHVAKTNLVAIGLYESLGFRLSAMNEEDALVWGERINDIYKYELGLTKVAMMQPSFLPWQGLFELIYHSDRFIFLDDFQFSYQSHHTRNKLFVNKDQVDYYNVPIQKQKSFEMNLNEVSIMEGDFWKNKILKRLQTVYAKSQSFKEIYPLIERWLMCDYSNLAQLNVEGIKMFCKILNIEKTFLFSSDFTKQTKSESTRSKRVEEILDWAKADKYLSAFGSFDYMKEDGFDYKRHPVIFQNYVPKPYSQIHSKEFVPYLSVLDALFNVGPEQTLELIKQGTNEWLSWENREKFSNA